MKTLSVRQPYAWLLVSGLKDVENRSWDTTHRGPLLIHAAAKPMTQADRAWLAELCTECGIAHPSEDDLRTGGIVGVVWLKAIRPRSRSPWWDGESLAWVMSNSDALEFIPCKGKLGLWDHPQPADLTLED